MCILFWYNFWEFVFIHTSTLIRYLIEENVIYIINIYITLLLIMTLHNWKILPLLTVCIEIKNIFVIIKKGKCLTLIYCFHQCLFPLFCFCNSNSKGTWNLLTMLIYSFPKNSSEIKQQEPRNKCTLRVRGQNACLAANHILISYIICNVYASMMSSLHASNLFSAAFNSKFEKKVYSMGRNN